MIPKNNPKIITYKIKNPNKAMPLINDQLAISQQKSIENTIPKHINAIVIEKHKIMMKNINSPMFSITSFHF